MYTLIIINAILAGIVFGLGFGLVRVERRFNKIQEATLKVYLNVDEKPTDKLLNELLVDIWNARCK